MWFRPGHKQGRRMSNSPAIKIGNQTAFSASLPTVPFDFALSSGFDAFEWFPDRRPSGEGWDESDIDAVTAVYIADSTKARNIRASVHAPWHANPGSAEGLSAIINDMDFALKLKASLLNIHYFGESGARTYANAIAPAIKTARDSGISLSIENTPSSAPGDFNELFGLIRDIYGEDARHVGMCFDMGHANLFGATRNDYIKYFDSLAPHVPIIHMHMHENFGDGDSHLALFTGPSFHNQDGIRMLLERLMKRGFSGSMILEQWPEPNLLLVNARNRLLAMIEGLQVKKN